MGEATPRGKKLLPHNLTLDMKHWFWQGLLLRKRGKVSILSFSFIRPAAEKSLIEVLEALIAAWRLFDMEKVYCSGKLR